MEKPRLALVAAGAVLVVRDPALAWGWANDETCL